MMVVWFWMSTYRWTYWHNPVGRTGRRCRWSSGQCQCVPTGWRCQLADLNNDPSSGGLNHCTSPVPTDKWTAWAVSDGHGPVHALASMANGVMPGMLTGCRSLWDLIWRSRSFGPARRIGAGSAAKRYTVARRGDSRRADRDPGRHAQLVASAAARHHAAAAKQERQRRTAGTDAGRTPGRARWNYWCARMRTRKAGADAAAGPAEGVKSRRL